MANSKLFCAVVVGSLGLFACSKQGATQEPESAAPASTAATPLEASSDPDPMAAAPNTGGEGTLEPGPIGATGPAGTAGAPATAAPASAGVTPAPAAPLTDGQILKVAEAVDKGEIEQSKEVQKKARNPQVKKLAAELIQHHTKNKQKGQSVGKKAQLTPEDSSVLSELSAKAEENLQTIKAAPDAKLAEQAYVESQIRQHENVLELLNTRLIPSAMNAELKSALEETRKMIETHIEEARRVKQAITETAGAAPAPGA
jgi:putative membrane protein